MRPLSLKGHDRALTRVRVNQDGDILFSSGKDKSPCVWYMENGERIGTYDGHGGVIWDIDVSWDTKNLCSASGDSSVKVDMSLFVWICLIAVLVQECLLWLVFCNLLSFFSIGIAKQERNLIL